MLRSTSMAQPPLNTGLLIVGHGTRKKEGVLQLLELAAQIRGLLPDFPIEPCFLELAEPTIDQGMESLSKLGIRKVIAVPILLFEAGHAKRDIPDAVQLAAKQQRIELIGSTPPLSCHPRIVELSERRGAQAIRNAGLDEGEGNLPRFGLAMVGRGGSDRSAIREMLRFTQLRKAQSSLNWAKTGFMAIARPNLTELLYGAIRTPLNTILVQPHLLFEGTLMDEIREKVREFQGRDPKRRWIIADPLGQGEELANVFVDLVAELLRSIA